MAKDPFEYQLDILRDEIGIIHARIGAFDTLSFQVKGWAATLWAGLVGYAVDKGNPIGVALSIPLMCVFWTLDAFFKSYQRRVRARMSLIERFLNRPPEDSEPSLRKAYADQSFGSFIIHDPMFNQAVARGDQALRESFARKVSVFRALRTSNVFLMYVALILSSLLVMLYLISKPL